MDLMKNEIKVRADADYKKIKNTAFYMLTRFLKGNDHKFRIKLSGTKQPRICSLLWKNLKSLYSSESSIIIESEFEEIQNMDIVRSRWKKSKAQMKKLPHRSRSTISL